ncbi:hypothetical protein SEVIR_1G298150v4 [Setaria viridis]
MSSTCRALGACRTQGSPRVRLSSLEGGKARSVAAGRHRLGYQICAGLDQSGRLGAADTTTRRCACRTKGPTRGTAVPRAAPARLPQQRFDATRAIFSAVSMCRGRRRGHPCGRVKGGAARQ